VFNVILDTNVVSEPLKRNGDPRCSRSTARRPGPFSTATSLSERFGIEVLPDSKRKKDGGAWSELLTACSNPHPAVRPASRRGIRIPGRPRRAGRRHFRGGGQIAAIAAAHGFKWQERYGTFSAAGVPSSTVGAALIFSVAGATAPAQLLRDFMRDFVKQRQRPPTMTHGSVARCKPD
jgi:hypothetical protein